MRWAGLALAGVGLLCLPALLPSSPTVAGDPVLRTAAPVYAEAPRSSVRAAAARPASGGPVGVDPAWVASTAAASGVPEPAVRAYGRAVLLVAAVDPGCRLGWTTLAGIGYVESVHGTIGGRTLGLDGRSSSPILGPALDGRGPVAAIPATPESSAWHEDPAWDHAIGPLQFIPSTWERWASDGDDDGVADPHDLDDAAYAAGRYLCADGHDLSTGSGWGAAVFAYNHAQAYVDSVYAAATAYASRTG